MNLVQVLWDCYWDKTLDEILEDGRFISVINISVFEGVVASSEGVHSDNNSRTTLQFKSHQYDICQEACVVGSVKKNPVNVGFVKIPCYN